MRTLSLEDIRVSCPSAFAGQQHSRMGEKYQFYPTESVISSLMTNGFIPVSAKQVRCRDVERRAFTRHVLRFRHNDFLSGDVGEEIPEIILRNAHDGTSSYQISIGLMVLLCSNGLAVQSDNILQMKIRHYGNENLIDNVIEGSYEVLSETPKLMNEITRFKGIQLDAMQQLEFAQKAITLRHTPLKIATADILHARRAKEEPNARGDRSLWATFNVVQENLIKGGVTGINKKEKTRTLREVKAADSDLRINRNLWALMEKEAA